MKIEPKSKLLMIGDSITDAERTRPIGEGGGLGHGYVSLVNALLGAVYPDRRIRVLNLGIGGNTVLDLKSRWQTDVLDLKPDWLSVMIGINDVWRQFDRPEQPETHIDIVTYEKELAALIDRTRPLLKGLVLMTPFYIEPSPEEPLRAKMDLYGAVVKKLAAQQGALFVDTQAAFNHVLQHSHSSALAWDRIHPGPVGHMVLARAFLHAVGFEW